MLVRARVPKTLSSYASISFVKSLKCFTGYSLRTGTAFFRRSLFLPCGQRRAKYIGKMYKSTHVRPIRTFDYKCALLTKFRLCVWRGEFYIFVNGVVCEGLRHIKFFIYRSHGLHRARRPNSSSRIRILTLFVIATSSPERKITFFTR